MPSNLVTSLYARFRSSLDVNLIQIKDIAKGVVNVMTHCKCYGKGNMAVPPRNYSHYLRRVTPLARAMVLVGGIMMMKATLVKIGTHSLAWRCLVTVACRVSVAKRLQSVSAVILLPMSMRKPPIRSCDLVQHLE